MHARALLPMIREDLAEKMVFLAGPRQVGKTTLARQVLELEGAGAYFSWDNIQHRRAARAGQWPEPPALLVLDELHKQRGWKRWLKGEYDAHVGEYRYLVTGSARLDVYRRGGDSLQGRYHHHRLHPFSVRELAGLLPGAEPGQPLALGTGTGSAKESTTQLLERGGFPEPFLSGSERSRRRWRKERSERFVREDVRELEAVRDLANIELLVDMLPERVGSPLSVNSLCRDLEVSHRAVSNWLEILSRLERSIGTARDEDSVLREALGLVCELFDTRDASALLVGDVSVVVSVHASDAGEPAVSAWICATWFGAPSPCARPGIWPSSCP